MQIINLTDSTRLAILAAGHFTLIRSERLDPDGEFTETDTELVEPEELAGVLADTYDVAPATIAKLGVM